MMVWKKMHAGQTRKHWEVLALIAGAVFLWNLGALGADPIFPVVEGWKISGEARSFGPDNLYEHIDGAAESYLDYDFRTLRVAEYATDGGTSLVIEIYEHRTPYHAFGIYSQERPSSGDYLGIGAQGYFDETILNFQKGCYYVKLSCFDAVDKTKEILILFARKCSEKLEGVSTLPVMLNCFPSKSKKQNSERFIAKNFLGYEFLHSAFKAEYESSAGDFALFIIEGNDPEDCKKMIGRYLEKNKMLRQDLKEGTFKVSDPYHGEVELCWEGKHIWGAVDCADPVVRSTCLKHLGAEIKKIQ